VRLYDDSHLRAARADGENTTATTDMTDTDGGFRP
jgi:hypothetical protein